MNITQAKWINGILHYFNQLNNHETLDAVAPVQYVEDFLVPALDTTNRFCVRDTAGATETLLADQPGGVVQLLLTNAAEIQLAGIDWADERQFCAGYGPIAEFRTRFTTLPVNATTAVFGLCGDHNAAIDTVAESIWFRFDFSGDATVETDDTATETSKVSTGVTVVANAWHVYKIDMSNQADCHFYIDGVRVATGTTFDMSNSATLVLQPVARLDKGADALNLGVMEVDYVKIWSKRS